MGIFDRNKFESGKQEYETPTSIFNPLNTEFDFTIDVCADSNNKKVNAYYSIEDDALTKTWSGVCWMNPPFGEVKKWIKKAYEESRKDNCVVVCLIPAKTNTRWWHQYCMKSEIRFIEGRPKFEGCEHGLPFPLAVVVMGTKYVGQFKAFKLST